MDNNDFSILVIEDDSDIRTLISTMLRKEGYVVFGAATGEDGLRIFKEKRPDLAILDLMLPGIDGMAVCRRIRKDKDARTSILMLTARSSDEDVVSGLETGADDYMVKPFSPRVLAARVRTLLRRSGKSVDSDAEDGVVCAGPVTVNPGRREVLVDGKKVELTAGEFNMLHTLVRRPGMVFTRTQLLDLVHGGLHAVTDRAVDVQIVGLRRKLGKAGEMVETVRGAGYRFSTE